MRASLVAFAAILPSLTYAESPPNQLPETKPAVVPTDIPETCPPATCPTISCGPCGPTGRVWVSGEYLAWWARGSRVPALASASPVGTPIEQAGALGTPGATTLFGGNEIDDQARHGFRVRAGAWLNYEHTCGIEGSFFWLGNSANPFTAGSTDGSNLVGRPYIDATTGMPSSQLVSFPGFLSGFVTVNTSSDFLGADALIRKQLCCRTDDTCSDPCGPPPGYLRVDLLAGYRFFAFQDRVTITENLMPLSPEVVPGTTIVVRDDFQARNFFHGGFLGVAAERSWGRCFVGGQLRVNVGAVIREVSINGMTTVTVPGDTTTVGTGGLLALPSNIGTYRSSEFTVIPEFELRAGCNITPRLRAFAGYTLIVWPNVVHAGEQIDPVVNPFLIPPQIPGAGGPARPTFPNRTSTLWVQGPSLGLEYRW